MPALADGPIRLSSDGLTVSMPTPVFREREIYIERLEEKVAVLEAALTSERQATDELRLKVQILQDLRENERQANRDLEAALLRASFSDKLKWGGWGFLGGVLTGVAVSN